MVTMSLQTQIHADGTLRLELVSGLPPGPVDVVVVVQSNAASSAVEDQNAVLALEGIWAGKIPDLDLDAELGEIRGRWKDQLEPSSGVAAT